MKPLSILHTESSIGWGGQEIRILTEMAGFVRRGHEVHLLAATHADIIKAARDRGLAVSVVPMKKKTLPAYRAVRAWLLEHETKFDVINTHSSTDSWLVALACASLKHKPPLVRTRHVSTAVNRGLATRWLYQQATTHIVTTGEALKAQLVRDNSFNPARITSVRTGIDLERFRPLDKTSCRTELGLAQRPTLGILATLRDWKGHTVLLNAWAQLREQFPDWRLLIIGDGPCRALLEARVLELACTESVQFVGNQEQVPVWLNSLDLFVLPSWGDEGVPQSIMQAMACGLAVVSTSVGAIAEAVQQGVTGLLVAPRDVAALRDALSSLMTNSDKRAQLAQAGLARAQSAFGQDAMFEAMEAVFHTCLEARR